MLERILEVLAPHDCVACGAEGALLCLSCRKRLLPHIERCYNCEKSSPGGVTCSTCLPRAGLAQTRAAYRYEAAAKDIVWRLKFERAQAAAREMAELMAPLVPSSIDWLVPVPTAPKRVRGRGYDQAVLLAKHLSRLSGKPYLSTLKRQGGSKQVGASRAERQDQLADAFWLKGVDGLEGQHILLIDDVLTTGATMEAVARLFRSAGAAYIEALTFAQA